MKTTGGLILAMALALAPAAMAQNDGESNHWDVKKLRTLIRERGYGFSVGENWVTHYLKNGGKMRDITGLLKPAKVEDFAKGARVANLVVDEDLPAAFDWRTEAAGGLQPIRNQGNCGSCWAFALTAVVESLVKIKDPSADPNFAEQTLVSNCERSYNCRGGYFDAFNYIKNPGLPNESQDPYLARNSSCKSGLESEQTIARWSYIGKGGAAPTIDEIKTAIRRYGPVAVDVNASFSSYSGGIYDQCNTRTTDHMVTLVGWNDDGQYWIMRNSWGKSWGEDGYMRIKYTDSRGRKCNGIGRVAAYAELPE